MPRPPFEPDDNQKRILDALKRLAEQRQLLDEQTDGFIVEAGRRKIPIDWIAKAANYTRKTVYRHLGKPMK